VGTCGTPETRGKGNTYELGQTTHTVTSLSCLAAPHAGWWFGGRVASPIRLSHESSMCKQWSHCTTPGTKIKRDDSGITPLSQQLNGPSYSRTHLTNEGLSQYNGHCATSFSRVLTGWLPGQWLPGTASDLSGGECNVDRTTYQLSLHTKRRFQ
jgi:hypothetical protein